jgi:hypothetical protein
MASLFDLLDSVCDRPGMFAANGRLAPIESMCHGYATALQNSGVHEFGADFNRRFCRYLESRHGYATDRGWANAIEANLRPNEDAFERLRTLVQGFKESGK